MDSTQELISAAITFALDWCGFDESRKWAKTSLCGLCDLGNLRLVKRFAEALRITSDEVEVIQQAGNLDIAIWLKDRYNLTAADARKVLALRCYPPEVVKWLLETFDLTADDAREAAADAREALKKACEFGYLLDGNEEIVDTLDGVLSGKPSY